MPSLVGSEMCIRDRFTGWINRDMIPGKISDASVGIGPLRLTDVTTRALPIKVLEYMAVGLPIIAQEGTLSEDVLVNEKNGYFFNGEDDLVSKITLLLDKPEKIERMSQESTKMVQKFSWDSVIRNIIEKVNKI